MKRPGALLAASLTGLYLLPIWCFRYFPSLDGPNHIVNAQILKNFGDPQHVYPKYFWLNISLLPNWLSHLWLAAWQWVVPALVAEKLLLSLYVILMSFAFWYLLRVIGHEEPRYQLLVFPFVYNYPLFLGFYNFSIGVPLAILALAFWWKHRENWSWRRVGILNGLLGAIFLAHLVPYLLAYALILVLALAYFRTRWRELLSSLFGLIPASLLGVHYALQSGFFADLQSAKGMHKVSQRRDELLWMDSLVSFDISAERRLGRLLLAIILLSIVFAMAFRLRQWVENRRIDLEPRDYWLVPLVVTLGFYFLLPGRVPGQGGIVIPRFNLLCGLLVLPWLKEDVWRWARNTISILAFALALLSLTHVTNRIRGMQSELRAYTYAVSSMPSNAIVLPLTFDRLGRESERVPVLQHASNYYCMDNGNINLSNYEAELKYFPVRFRPEFKRPAVFEVDLHPDGLDYRELSSYVTRIVAFGESPEVLSRVEEYFELVLHEGRLRIFRPRQFRSANPEAPASPAKPFEDQSSGAESNGRTGG